MANERTINGKKLNEILDEFHKSVPKDKISQRENDSIWYIEESYYTDLLNRVVTPFNYDFEVTEPVLTNVSGTKTTAFILNGSLTIKDDEGNVVAKQMASGGSQVNFLKSTGEPTNLENIATSAMTDVFKKCCKRFGMGGETNDDLRQKNKKAKSKGKSSGVGEEVKLFEVKLESNFTSFSKGYKAFVTLPGESNQVELVIWNNGVEKIEQCIPISNFLSRYKKDCKLKCYGHFSTFNNNRQLIYDEPFIMASS